MSQKSLFNFFGAQTSQCHSVTPPPVTQAEPSINLGEDGGRSNRTARGTTVKGWKENKYGWLEFEETEKHTVTKMWCRLCRRYPEAAKGAQHRGQQQMTDTNAYITGTTNIKLDCVRTHAKSRGHLAAEGAHFLATAPTRTPIVRSLMRMNTVEEDKMVKLFDLAYNIAKQELPFTQFQVWAKTEKKHGVLLGEAYINDIQCKNLINEIAFEMERDLKNTISRPRYLGIMFDGSTDASCHEREVISVKYTDNGVPVTKFLGMTEPEYGTADGILASLQGKLHEFDLDLASQLVGIAADGASVNFGSRNGIITQLKQELPWLVNTHCTAHREELAVKDAFKGTQFADIDEILLRVYYLYHKSPKRWRELRRLASVSGDSVVKPVRSCGTRWVTHKRDALRALLRDYNTLIQHFEDISSSQRQDISGEDCARIKGYLKKLKTFKFLYWCHCYLDILEKLCQLSLVFQNDMIAISFLSDEIEGTLTELKLQRSVSSENLKKFENLLENSVNDCIKFKDVDISVDKIFLNTVAQDRHKFIDQLCSKLNDRFKSFFQDPILKACCVIDPSKWPYASDSDLDSYGNEEIKLLAENFSTLLNKNECAVDMILPEWMRLKRYVRKNVSVNSRTGSVVWLLILNETNCKANCHYNIGQLIDIVLSLPISSAHVERCFSLLKRIVSDWRSSLGIRTIQSLMRIATDGPDDVTDFNSKPAVAAWYSSSLSSRRPNIVPYGSRQHTDKEQ